MKTLVLLVALSPIFCFGQCNYTYTIFATNPQCAGMSDGSINVVITQGDTAFFSYLITDSFNTIVNTFGGSFADSLPAGVYDITLVDSLGCSSTDSVVLIDPPPLLANISVYNPYCNGSGIGTASIVVDTVYNAQGNYNQIQYIWSPNAGTNGSSTQDSVGNLSFGTYTLSIIDALGCTYSTTIVIDGLFFTSTGSIIYSTTIDNSTTFNDGDVYCTVGGGTAPYSYLWTDLANQSTHSDSVWTDLPEGDYAIAVTDAAGCTIYDTVTIAFLSNGTIEFEKISLFPNPLNNHILTVSGVENASIQIYDNVGRLIITENIVGHKVNLNLSDGLYIYKITERHTNKELKSGRLVVIK